MLNTDILSKYIYIFQIILQVKYFLTCNLYLSIYSDV